MFTYGHRVCLCIALATLIAPVASGQSTAADADAPAAAVDSGSLQERVERLEAKLEKMGELEAEAARSDALEQRVAGLEEQLEAQEMAELEALENAASDEQRSFDLYGFFDLGFYRHEMLEKHALNGVMANHWSFTITNLNIYIASQLTKTVSALVELRFTFQPNGMETWVPYERVDTRVADRFNTEEFKLGGVAIERVQMTWQPFQFFGVTIGRYLTPYGIWNIDHGSPVVLPALLPYLQLRQAMPLAQTGALVHGRFIPTGRLFLDYAVTVSNGRGPTEETLDLDNNKAIGVRLKGEVVGDQWLVRLGGYGYYGKVTDVTKTVQTTQEGFSIDVDPVSRYDEWIASVDFLLQVHGVRLQSEYVTKRIKYDVPPRRTLPVVYAPLDGYQPNNLQWDIYVMLAWELPLGALLGDMRLTPYAMFEYSVQDDTQDAYTVYLIRGGLNFMPNPFVAIKATAFRLRAVDPLYIKGDSWVFGGQVAVSF